MCLQIKNTHKISWNSLSHIAPSEKWILKIPIYKNLRRNLEKSRSFHAVLDVCLWSVALFIWASVDPSAVPCLQVWRHNKRFRWLASRSTLAVSDWLLYSWKRWCQISIHLSAWDLKRMCHVYKRSDATLTLRKKSGFIVSEPITKPISKEHADNYFHLINRPAKQNVSLNKIYASIGNHILKYLLFRLQASERMASQGNSDIVTKLITH